MTRISILKAIFFNFFEIKSFCYNFNYAIIYSVVKIEIATPNV